MLKKQSFGLEEWLPEFSVREKAEEFIKIFLTSVKLLKIYKNGYSSLEIGFLNKK